MELKEKIAKGIGKSIEQIGSVLTSIGVKCTPNSNNMRVLIYAHPEWEKKGKKGVPGLRLRVAVSGAGASWSTGAPAET